MAVINASISGTSAVRLGILTSASPARVTLVVPVVKGWRNSCRRTVLRAMVQETVQGPPSVYARDMERLSAKESLLLALKDAGGFEALVTGKTTNMQRIDVNERITSLERLNPTPRPTTSPFFEGRWNFEWFGSGSPGLLAARVIFERFPSTAYDVLSDPENRRQYDTTGSEDLGPENEDLELDLSSLGAVNTIFAALFNKLGVQIKTTVSANLLEEALNGMVTTLPLSVGQVVSRKVEKQSAHFYSVSLTEEEAQAGLICKVQSSAKNKFKLLYFDQEENGGLRLALQEDSKKTGKLSTAGLYFFDFPVYHFDHRVNSRALSRDPETGYFKRLDAFQPFEITELKPGSHAFAVYGFDDSPVNHMTLKELRERVMLVAIVFHKNLGKMMETHGSRLLGSSYKNPLLSLDLFQRFSVENPKVYCYMCLKRLVASAISGSFAIDMPMTVYAMIIYLTIILDGCFVVSNCRQLCS